MAPKSRKNPIVTAETDARIAAESTNQQLLDTHFLGFGTLNFENSTRNPNSANQQRTLQWATQNVRPLNQQHVATIAHRMQSDFVNDGNHTAINLPVLKRWLTSDSWDQIRLTKTADWTNPDALAELPQAAIIYENIFDHELKPLSGHVRLFLPLNDLFRLMWVLLIINYYLASVPCHPDRTPGAALHP
jgi:hypothetical protein